MDIVDEFKKLLDCDEMNHPDYSKLDLTINYINDITIASEKKQSDNIIIILK